MRVSRILAVLILFGVSGWVVSGQLDLREPEAAQAPAPRTVSSVEEPPRTKVRVRRSLSEPFVVTLRMTGETEAHRSATIDADVDGRIEEIAVEEGDRVEKGQLIARIGLDDRPQRLARAEAQLERFQIAHDISVQLAEGGWRTENANAEARANLVGAQADLEAIRIDIAKTRIVAPFSGVIEELHVEVGDMADSGADRSGGIGRIYDLDPIVVVLAASEREVPELAVGDPGTIRLLTGEEASGTVRYIGRVADPATRTYRVELEAPNPDLAIAVGMTAEVTLPRAPVDSHLVSASALSLADDGTLGIKLVDASDAVRFHPVAIAATEQQGFRLAGLPDEIRLITVGHDYVIDGEQVEPVEVDGSRFSRPP